MKTVDGMVPSRCENLTRFGLEWLAEKSPASVAFLFHAPGCLANPPSSPENLGATSIGLRPLRLPFLRICVLLCVMRTASVYEVQHNFSKVLSWVNSGETVIIQRRNVPVAKLVPTEDKAAPPLPDFLKRLKQTYKERVLQDSARILDELREDRF
jgi:antitoxin (DNA-binding transcriptional repressor) of toxin-antitoxin stability system